MHLDRSHQGICFHLLLLTSVLHLPFSLHKSLALSTDSTGMYMPVSGTDHTCDIPFIFPELPFYMAVFLAHVRWSM